MNDGLVLMSDMPSPPPPHAASNAKGESASARRPIRFQFELEKAAERPAAAGCCVFICMVVLCRGCRHCGALRRYGATAVTDCVGGPRSRSRACDRGGRSASNYNWLWSGTHIDCGQGDGHRLSSPVEGETCDHDLRSSPDVDISGDLIWPLPKSHGVSSESRDSLPAAPDWRHPAGPPSRSLRRRPATPRPAR